MKKKMKSLRLVILCGGSGSRLWPESRASLPKQFIPILEDKSLLDLTIERILNINSNLEPIFICSKKHGFIVKNTISKYKLNAKIFLEPEGKNTCAAIYLAAKFCGEAENLLIMPSDHIISNDKKFAKEIIKINETMPSDNWITLGIKPNKPSEAYGYIEVSNNDKSLFKKVLKFIEKPNKKTASQLIMKSNVFWNAGIFMGNAKFILNSIKNYAPNITDLCDNTYDKKSFSTNGTEINFCPKLFSNIPSKSIDYAVMEKEKKLYLYRLNCIWNDLGSWDSVAEMFKPKKDSKIVEINSKNNFIRKDKRIIATIGVKDLVIIDSDNAILISKKNETEKVKSVVNNLLNKNITEAAEHSFENRPWGKFENLYADKNCKVKRIIVDPNKRLSLQYHNYRSEHWLVIKGTANVYLDGNNIILTSGQSIDIPVKSKHFVENKHTKDLIIIETQLGSYFGEDDIIRLDDPYDR